ncbi:hypothetical protein roselon_01149 [Roseibacterium elongatum DSM 19469]|uniref:Uncharacterized protein n=1 Tax=Roseicyclus elongatus DSM 19469 TaxID=1294273 RepID=W8SLX8_9RHOB|nr:DUF6478 family protein [Roseibacterium elongatum]AHM03540.1 hypothetical protein roselon_01149 [Roseibacterium elongatum DSM 19469]
MGEEKAGLFGRFRPADPLTRWQRAMAAPSALSTSALSEMNSSMRAMRDRLDTLAAKARTELLSRVSPDDVPGGPEQCDWAMRPAPWRVEMRPRGLVSVASPMELPGAVKLFHDAAHADLSIRQDRVPHWIEGALFGLVLEVYQFDGSFVSLVQDLPQAAIDGLTLAHVITVDIRVEREHPVEVYARLNIQHGPNTETMVRQLDIRDGAGRAEFDLAYSKVNEKRIEKAWLDLIIEGPEMTRIALWDMTVSRAPRADL